MLELLSKLSVSHASFPVSTFIELLEKNQINIDTSYQREVVWSDDKFENFINSCFHKIIPNPVILNKSIGENKKIIYNCIDGKHRLTSLLKYVDNKISFKHNGMKYFYSKTPTNQHSIDETVLSEVERKNFNNILIPVVIYDNIEEEDEKDIFNRIQLGKPLATGELVLSNFNNARVKLEFIKYCDTLKPQLSKYISIKRKTHYEFIIFLMKTISANRLIKAKPNDLRSFISNLTINRFENLKNRLSPTLNYVFSDNLLLNPNFKIIKIELNVLYSFIFFVFNKYCDKFPNANDSIRMRNLLRSVINHQTEYGNSKLSLSEFSNITKQIEEIFKQKGLDDIVLNDIDEDNIIKTNHEIEKTRLEKPIIKNNNYKHS